MTSSSSSSPEISAAITADSTDHPSLKYSSRDEVLEDLSSRFILNLPDEELASLERVCFQVEQAHWFYEDFVREENPQFPSLPLKRFSEELFNACPMLHQWRDHHEHAFNKFMQYKTRVPVCGAIMLNSKWDKCVLVKGWKSSSGWGFPKGKINESESPANCAVREVLEETGYNLAGQVNPEYVIEMFIKEQSISLYIVPDVPEDYPFQTKTRKEISRIEWFKLTDLPTWKRNKACPGRFYLISPFIAKLKEFVNTHKPRISPRKGAKAKNNNVCQAISYDTTLESSSQSSDPHTPSPRSPELLAHVAEPEAGSTPQLGITVLDPHFASLLTKLNVSVSSMDKPKENKPLLSQLSLGISSSPEEEPTTPVPVTTSSGGSFKLPTPNPSLEKLLGTQVGHEGGLNSTERSSTVAPATSASFHPIHESMPPPPPGLHDSRNKCSTSPFAVRVMDQRSSSTVPQQPESPRSSTSSPLMSRAQRSHRTRSTADISPYLSKAEPISVSRQMRQLSLLESVVKDSERTTPMQSTEQALNHSVSPMTGGLSRLPPLPIPHLHDPNDLSVIYSSGSTNVPLNTVHIPQRPFSVMDDPFQVRDRSRHLHFPQSPSLFHPPPSVPPMHYSMTPAPAWASSPIMGYFPPPGPHPALLPRASVPPGYSMTQNSFQHQPHSALVPGGHLPPFPSTRLGGGMSLPPPPPPSTNSSNAALLSILNNSGYQPANL